MKYTKAFQKYWSNTSPDFHNLEMWEWEAIKQVAFRAWKAGIKKCSAELIKPGRDEDKYNV